MDEREVRALLTHAAESVDASDDLAARAERRYRRRRARGRVLAAAVAVVVVGAGVATAAAVGGEHTSAPPIVEPTPNSVVTPTSTPRVPDHVAVESINALSFVDAKVGFARADRFLARTDDGGRSWRGVAPWPAEAALLHFETESDGVAWGSGPLQVTSDGGATWSIPNDGPVDNELAWAGGRLWALTPCVQSEPCGPDLVRVSDDVGRTWRPAGSLHIGIGSASIVAFSRASVVLVARADFDEELGYWKFVKSDDAGASWKHAPAPCSDFTENASLASNGQVMVLACVGQPAGDTTQKQVFTSSDGGTTWQPAVYIPGQNAQLTNFGSTLISNPGRTALLFSTDNARSWQTAFPASAPVSLSVVPGVGAWAFAYQGSGLWFSRDGVQWTRVRSPATPPPPPVDLTGLSSLSFVDADHGYAFSDRGIVRSDDGGRTWSVVNATGFSSAAGLHFETESDGLAWGGGAGFTRDGGRTWSPTSISHLDVLSWSEGRVWAYTPCPGDTPCGPRPLFVSDSVGATWEQVTTFNPGIGDAGIAVVDDETAYLLEATSDRADASMQLKVTRDGGGTWTTRPVPCEAGEKRSVAANGQTVLVTCPYGAFPSARNHLLISTDDGASWEQREWPFNLMHFEQVIASGSAYFGLNGSYGAVVSTDNGRSWGDGDKGDVMGYGDGGGVRFSTRPGVGVWAYRGGGGGVWFSPDAEHWEVRMRPRS